MMHPRSRASHPSREAIELTMSVFAPDEPGAGLSVEVPHANARVLLVEDSDDDALLIRAELGKLRRPFELTRVQSRSEMRGALARERFDIVITDHQLPGFDSREAAEELRNSGQDAPLIIMSGTLPEQTGALAMLHGASDFIDKSSFARLVPVIERELRNAAMRRAKDAVERTVVHMTFHDGLTGIANRLMLERLIQEHVETTTAVRSALIVLDLDRFLRVNEAVGYAGGNDVLQQVAVRLRDVAADETIARIGADSFAVYLPTVNGEGDARTVASRILAALDVPFKVAADSLFVHASVGICLFPEAAATSAELINNAERAQLTAKATGPGSVAVYARRVAAVGPLSDPVRLESALREAIDKNQFFLLYQPLVDLGSGRMTGVEALVRWRHPTQGPIGPQAFIPLAEETGLIGDLGQWVLREACRTARRWHDTKLEVTVAVNVSPSQFREPAFVSRVAQALAESGLPPRYLELELIESELMSNVETTMAMLTELKRMGVRLSIDDFGTGYSSLSYLTRLPIDALKIDKSFLHGIDTNVGHRAIAATIAALAKNLNLSVVAEGVETQEQLAAVRAMACDRAQGYYIARPLPAAHVASFATYMLP